MSLLNNLFGSGAQQALIGTSLEDHYKNHMQHLRAQEDLEILRKQQQYAAQAQMNQAQNAYTKNLAQSMMNAKQQVTGTALGRAIPSTQVPFNPNEIEAYKIPLSQLVTLWQAKFGDEWTQKFDDEEFWFDAMFRLKAAGKLEEAKHTWYRIKEDA